MDYAEMVQALKAERQRQRMYQWQLADRMGVHQSNIWMLETGQINRSNYRTLSRWAAALGKTVRIEYTLEDLEDEQ